MKVAIIGAGPAGLSAAYNLAKDGVQVEVFEASDSVGGLARTFELWGHKVDLGPHRFYSHDPRVNRLWLELVGRDYRMVPRRTRILYRGRYFHYPLRAINVLAQLGPWEAARCIVSYLLQIWRPHPTRTSFEGWVVHHFGRRLYELFFQSYTEKLWGISGDELDSDFASQRIQKFSLWKAIRAALWPSRNPTAKTLVEQFAYPLGGTGMVYERMAEAVRSMGGAIRLNTPVQRVLLENDRVTGLALEGGKQELYDRVVSTMPLTLLVEGLDAPEQVRAACGSLRFRNTILVYLKIEHSNLFPDNWLYVHSPELRLGRITNYRNWVPELYGRQSGTVLSLEYWCDSDEALWSSPDEELVALACSELQATGLLQGFPIEASRVVRVPRCYPIYLRGYRRHVETVREFLSGLEGLDVIGRYGSFKYNNQDHSLLMGLLAAENICHQAGHSLWELNSDTEYFERSRISETGLVLG